MLTANQTMCSLLLAALALVLAAGCGDKKTEPAAAAASKAKPADPSQPMLGKQKKSPALAEAQRRTEKAYELKLAGKNGEALAALESIRRDIVAAAGPASAALASNLDDQASIHMRLGDYAKARDLFREAQAILEQLDPPSERLRDGVTRRLALLELFEKQGVRCKEPLAPQASALPYFPSIEELQRAVGRMNDDLKDCVKGALEAVTVYLVATGDGRVVEAAVRDALRGTPESACLERRILEVAPSYAAGMPRFGACFRSFTYAFMVGAAEPPKSP